MGNCLAGDEASKDDGKPTTDHTSLHQGIVRERNNDVYQKYEEHEVLGQGSMGHVARVQIKDGAEGGSAFKSGSKVTKTSSSLSERRSNRVDYALKSIQLDRVSPMFLEELQNEIDILKTMVSTDGNSHSSLSAFMTVEKGQPAQHDFLSDLS